MLSECIIVQLGSPLNSTIICFHFFRFLIFQVEHLITTCDHHHHLYDYHPCSMLDVDLTCLARNIRVDH